MSRLNWPKLDGRGQIFTGLWAMALIYHYIEAKPFAEPWLVGMSVFIFFLCSWRDGRTLFVLALVHAGMNLLKWPDLANHQVLALFTNLFILMLFVRYFVKRTPDLVSRGLGALPYLLLLVYFFAFFHKLNHEFFDLNKSCGTFLYEKIRRGPLGAILPFELWAFKGVIWGTLIIELLAPLALLFRKTRAYGIILALILHGLLAFGVFYDFAAHAVAVLFLFFAPEYIQQRLKLAREGFSIQKVLKLSFFLAIGLSIGAYFLLGAQGEIHNPDYHFAQALVWLAGTLYLFFVFSNPLRARYLAFGNLGKTTQKILGFFLLLVFLNGISPYLGLKTVGVFSMFSNLRTEDQKNNHFLVPQNFRQPFDYQRDLCQIQESLSPPTEWTLDRSTLVPRLEVQRKIAYWLGEGLESLRLDLKCGNQSHSLNSPKELRDFANQAHYFEQKFLAFRAVPPPGNESCQW